jgi:hypothetical protein
MIRAALALLLFCVILPLAACGNKGDLVKPAPPAQADSMSATG